MLAVTLKNLWGRKLRLITTGMAILIGVAFMAGTMVLTDTVTATFNDLFADVNRDVDVQVRRAERVVSEGMDIRSARIDESLVSEIAGVPGVRVAAGLTQGYTQLSDADGEPIGNPGRGAPTFGMSWLDDDALNPFVVVEGRAPQADDEIVIDRGSAKKGRLAVGDVAHVDAARPVPPLRIVGIVTFGRADSPAGASYVGYTPSAAQQYVGEPGKVGLILVAGEEGVTQKALRDRVAGVLPGGLEARTGAEATAEAQESMARNLSFFSTFMLSFALVALFVGSFIIFNTFSILVAQRMREIALLRAVGASGRQVVNSVMIEAAVVGLTASVLGVTAGIGVAVALKALLAGVGMEVPAAGVVLTMRTVWVSLAVGTVVTVLAAVLPARRAARIAPVEAIAGAAAEREDNLARRLVLGTILTAVGSATGAYGLFIANASEATFVGVGGAVTFVGIATLGPVIARPVVSLLGRPLPRLRGMPGTLATQNALRNPRRTSSTASALMIGVALVGFITIFASSAKAHIHRSVGEQFAGDFVVQSSGRGIGGLDPAVAQRIAALPEVEAASGLRPTLLQIGNGGVVAAAVDPDAFASVLDLAVVEGSFDDMGDDGLAVHIDELQKTGWNVGDTVSVTFSEGDVVPLTLRAVYTQAELAPGHLISTAMYDRYVPRGADHEIYVKKAAGVSTAEAAGAIRMALGEERNAQVIDREGYIEEQTSDINQMLGLIYVLLVLAIVIAVLGIANTLALSIHERSRELGLLRAVGMTRTQLRTAVRWEAVIIALLGTVIGLGVAVAFGWAMVMSVADEGLDALVIPAGPLAVIAGLAGVCGLAAAIRPARRAARLNVLDAIATA